MKKIMLWTAGVLIIFGGGAALLIGRIDTGFVVERIADATAAATGKPLIFTTAPGLSLFPPGVSFGEAHWGEITDGKGTAVAVKGGMAQLELLPLLSGTIVVREIRLDNPVLEIHGAAEADARQAPAHGQVQTPAKTPTQASAQTSEQAPADKAGAQAAPSDTLPVELMRLVVRRGEIIYVTDDAQLRIKDLNISVENLRSREEASLQCDFALDMPSAEKESKLSGNLALSAKLRYAGAELHLRQTSLTFTPLSGLLPKEAGPIQLSYEGSLTPADLRLRITKLTLHTPQLRGTLIGNAVLTPPAFSGTLDVEGSPRKAAALAGLKLKPANPPSADALLLQCAPEYDGNTLYLRSLNMRLDAVPLQGELSLTPARVPTVTGELRMGMLDLNNYLPLPAATPPDKSSKSDKGGKSPAGKAAGDKTEDVRNLPRLDLRLTATGIRFNNVLLKDISGTLKGAQGKYALAPLAFSLASGGTIKGSVETDLSSKAHSLALTAAGVQVGALLEALGKGRPVDGVAALNATCSTRGDTAAAVQAALNGKGTLDVRNLSAAGIPAMLKSVPGLKAVPERFDLLRVPFVADKGEITARPVTLTSRELTASGRATASLPRSYLDANFEVKTLGLTIPVTAKGPFSDISYGVDPKFTLDLAKKLPGALLQKGAEGGSTAGGILKDAPRNVGGVVRGLFGR